MYIYICICTYVIIHIMRAHTHKLTNTGARAAQKHNQIDKQTCKDKQRTTVPKNVALNK